MPGDRIEIPVWLIPKKGALDNLTKTGIKMPGSGGESTQSPITKMLKLWKFDLVWKWIKGTWNFISRFSPILKAVGDAIDMALGMILTAGLLPFLPEIVSVLKLILSSSASILKWSSDNNSSIREFMGKLFKWVLPIDELNNLTNSFKEYWNIINNFLPIGRIVTGIFDLIGKSAKFVLNHLDLLPSPMFLLKQGLNLLTMVLDTVISALKLFGSFLEKVWNVGGTLGKKIGLADGGIVTSPTNALIGEAGPEAVIPLDQLDNMGGNTSVKVFIDGKEFRGMIKEEIEKSNRRLYNVRGAIGI